MSSMDFLSILGRMDKMIRMRCTGCPSEFAQRIGVSERTLYNYLRILKEEIGVRKIHYNKYFRSYEYID